MLKLENIKKYYGELQVLDIPSWEVADGDSVALLGANATGKTTLLEIIAGLQPASEGFVKFDGKPVTAPVREIGIVLQNPVMFSASVGANIGFGLHAAGINGAGKEKRINETLEIVGLAHLVRKSATILSEGQKQRVAIARTLALKPKLLLLDEPSASVDRESALRIADILRSLNTEGKLTIIVATHDIDFARRIAMRADLMRNGRPVPYIAGNMFSGLAVAAEGQTRVTIGEKTTLLAGGEYHGPVDVAIPPEHVVLSKQQLESSMRNSFRGRITLLGEEDGMIRAVVDIGVPLVTVLTRSALTDLGVTIGDEVYASFKAHGVLVFPRE